MKKQYLILMAGPCGSGKTVLAKKITETFPELQHIDSQAFREFVSSNYALYKDFDSSVNSFEKRSMNRIARSFMGNMLEELIKGGHSIIFDATLLRPETRTWRIKEAKHVRRDLTTVIIGLNTDPKTIEERLAIRDAVNPEAQWVQNYREFVVDTYTLPSPDEADYVHIYEGNDENCTAFLKQVFEN